MARYGRGQPHKPLVGNFDYFATVTTTRTETGVARIQKSVTATETGIARIQKSVAATETGVARITASTTRTETGVARMQTSVLQTETGVARIQKAVTQDITGVANITVNVTTTQTIDGVAAIQNTTTQTETGKAAIQKTTTQTITGVANITTANPRYWVGGTDTWDATAGTKWSLTSGGAGGASVPDATTDVFFDASSSGNITLSSSSIAKSINCTGFTGTITHPAATTISIGGTTAGASNIALKLVSGMTYTKGNASTSAFSFVSTSSTQQTIDSGGKTMGNITINGSGSSYLLAATFTQDNTASFTLTNGTFNTGGNTTSFGSFGLGSGTKTLTFGSSTVNIIGAGGPFNLSTNSSGLTFNSDTSSLVFNPTTGSPAFNTGGFTYYDVSVIKSSGGFNISGGGTFHNITHDNTVVGSGNRPLTFNTDTTINGVLTYTANNSTSARGFLNNATTVGVTRTIDLGTTGSVALTDIDVRDIAFIGTAAPVDGSSCGDAGGNSGITFAAAVTRYWVGDSGSYSDDTNHWSATSGGAPGASMPKLHDFAVFDANSFSTTGLTVQNNMMRAGNMDWSAVTNSPTFNFLNPNGATNGMWGNITYHSSMSLTVTGAAGGASSLNFFGNRGAASINHAGLTLPSNMTSITVQAGTTGGGVITFTGDLHLDASRTFTISNGGVDFGSATIDVGVLNSSGSSARSVDLNAATINLNGTGTVFQLSTMTNLTFDAGTSVINITDTSSSSKTIAHGSGITLYDVNIATGGSGPIIFGANTLSIHDFTVNGGLAELQFTAGSGSTTTFTGTVDLLGTSGNLVKITSTTTAAHYLVFSGVGTVNGDYLDIQHSIASPSNTWFAGLHSVDNQATSSAGSGWIFSAQQTIQGLARIQTSVAQTITGKAAVQATTTQTETGTSAIQSTSTQDILGTAAVQATSTQDIDGVGRIQITSSSDDAPGNALRFDGVNGSLLVPHSASVNVGNADSYSVVAWFKSTTKKDQSVSEKWSTGGSINKYPWALRGPLASNGRFQFAIYDGTSNPGISTIGGLNGTDIDYADGAWHLVVGVRDHAQDKLFMYMDGNLVTNGLTDSTSGDNVATDRDIRIGSRNATGQNFDGDIDGFALYGRVLTAAEVTAIYNSYTYPTDSRLVFINMDEGHDTTAYDTSGNNNHGQFSASGITWIRGLVPKAMEGVSRIQASVAQTVDGVANIFGTTVQTITGVGRVIYGTAFRSITILKTKTGKTVLSVPEKDTAVLKTKNVETVL